MKSEKPDKASRKAAPRDSPNPPADPVTLAAIGLAFLLIPLLLIGLVAH